jgi:hypothetical protein
MSLALLKEGGEEVFVFVGEDSVGGEAGFGDGLGGGLPFADLHKVVRDPTKAEIELHDLRLFEPYFPGGEKFLSFVEAKREQANPTGHPIIEPSFGVNEVINHPGGGAPTENEREIGEQ